MRYYTRNWVIASISGLLLLTPLALPQEKASGLDAKQQATLKLAQEVRRRIITQPQFGVFDHIHFAIEDNTVILRGRASRPILKSNIENAVRRIEGVSKVENEIEVLPLSPNDDRLRAALYASIYGFPALQRYTSNRGGPRNFPSVARAAGGITNDPPIGRHAIHIIVENGHVTLTGVVDSEADLAIAGMRANIVPGVFSVDNDLQVARAAPKG
ncbi:MAG: BON domain-containing protein [Bryobacterales bacterium]|nr:BON domain-containing protein [Bryobacterales bacterium]MBV9399672.1 BON domain-containing protein [Bryobacterales bacterium]